jgi:hypothetical protein
LPGLLTATALPCAGWAAGAAILSGSLHRGTTWENLGLRQEHAKVETVVSDLRDNGVPDGLGFPGDHDRALGRLPTRGIDQPGTSTTGELHHHQFPRRPAHVIHAIVYGHSGDPVPNLPGEPAELSRSYMLKPGARIHQYAEWPCAAPNRNELARISLNQLCDIANGRQPEENPFLLHQMNPFKLAEARRVMQNLAGFATGNSFPKY